MRSARDDGHRRLEVDGATVAYRSAGVGPAIVMIKNNRRPLDFGPVELLADRFRVLQVQPVGFGASARPDDYAFGSIDRQVLAVLDHEGVDGFVAWGFSQMAFMAAMAVHRNDRARGLILGGTSLIGFPTDATMRRLEREPRLPKASLEFWRASRRFDWHLELRDLGRPVLIYVGTADPGWPRFRKLRPVLRGCGCDCVELPDLDHQTSGPGDAGSGRAATVSAVRAWIDDRFPSGW